MRKLFLDRIVIPPVGFEPVEIAPDPKLDGRPFERIAERRFHSIAAIGLFAGRANVHFGDPAFAEFEPQSAHHRIVRQQLILILPVLDSENFIESILNDSNINVSECQRPITFHRLRLELDVPGVKRQSKCFGDRFRIVWISGGCSKGGCDHGNSPKGMVDEYIPYIGQ